jgi:hypothetical protein
VDRKDLSVDMKVPTIFPVPFSFFVMMNKRTTKEEITSPSHEWIIIPAYSKFCSSKGEANVLRKSGGCRYLENLPQNYSHVSAFLLKLAVIR